MSSQPPPLLSSVESPEPSAFARQAANACLAAPLLMIGLSFCLSSLLQNHRDASGRPLFVTVGLVEVGFFVTGVVLPVDGGAHLG